MDNIFILFIIAVSLTINVAFIIFFLSKYRSSKAPRNVEHFCTVCNSIVTEEESKYNHCPECLSFYNPNTVKKGKRPTWSDIRVVDNRDR